jgi:hypothetical protein
MNAFGNDHSQGSMTGAIGQVESASGAAGNGRKRRLGAAATRAAAALLVATAAIGAGASPAAAANYDPRISAEYQITCLGDTYGLTPTVRIQQPWVVGTRSTWETISWRPFLQVYTTLGWQNVSAPAGYFQFIANSSGPNIYYFTYQRQVWTQGNLTRGYYYRIVHLIHWGSTGEYGTMPSDYRYASGHCKL